MMTMLKHSTRATRTRRFFSYRALWQTAHTIIFQVAALLPDYKTPQWVLPLRGRCKPRSNLFPTDLPLTPVTYSSKRLRMSELGA
ncbi:Uncharacterised protein [Serratia liquefaciens]|nr:Uncharacterised protein [Serratia liquefaciens]